VLSYAIRRTLWTIPVLFLVVTLLFFMMRSIGGSPLRRGQLVGISNVAWSKSMDWRPESIERNMEREFGLDRPWHRQYASYLESVVRFDFGSTHSYRYLTVNSIIKRQGKVSLELGLLAFLVAVAIGIPLGALAALKQGTLADTAARFLTAGAAAVPAFLVGPVLIALVAVHWELLPTNGWDSWQAKLLPTLTLALVPAAWCARLVRGAMLETLRSDYVRAASAKGLRRSRVVGVHVLRNSLVPVVTALGPILGILVTGSFIVEEVFSIPGIGRYYVAAVLARDYPLVLGLTVVLTVAVVVANLLVDVLHALLDPRIRDAVTAR
jgi:ABC-type dipeptide/oligopeptide/nickel transport system permease component